MVFQIPSNIPTVTQQEEAHFFLPVALHILRKKGYINRTLLADKLDISKKLAGKVMNLVFEHFKQGKWR